MAMQACERSDNFPEDKASHTHCLASVDRSGYNVLARAKMATDGTSIDLRSTTITMQLPIRSTDPSVVQVIASAFE